jgi:hypothetical protein
VAEGEHRDRDEPIEQFLKILIPEIERRIASAESPAAPAPPKTSMGGPGSGAPGGGASDRPGPAQPGGRHLVAIPSTTPPEQRTPRDPRRPAGQDRGPADQADNGDHGQQVEG